MTPACPYCRRDLVDLGALRLYRLAACDARQHGPFPLVFQVDPGGATAIPIKSQVAGVLAQRILALVDELRAGATA
jgi:hypothetical protein